MESKSKKHPVNSLARYGPSPPRRKPIPANPIVRGGRWPSSKKPDDSSLVHYLENDHSDDDDIVVVAKRTTPTATGPASLSRNKSSSTELSRFEEKPKKDSSLDDRNVERMISKENRPFGGSMRYIGKLRFNKKSSSECPISDGRMSVDGSALTRNYQKTDFGIDTASNESERSDHSKGYSPKAKLPRAPKKDTNYNATSSVGSMKRTSSMPSPWALSPARTTEGSLTPARSFSSLRPAGPEKGRKVGNIITMGLDLFRRKSGSGSGLDSTTSGKTLTASTSFSTAIGDTAHRLRLVHNCSVQWHYVNAKSDSVEVTKASFAESTFLGALAEIMDLRSSVVYKRMQLGREELKFKLSRVLSSQLKPLEGWGEIEQQHSEALSTTKNCLESAVCRLPLVDRSKADPQLLSIWFRQATNLAANMKTTIGTFSPMAQSTVKLISELAEVAAQERALLEECLDTLGYASSLQIQEQSLRCHLVQLRSLQHSDYDREKSYT